MARSRSVREIMREHREMNKKNIERGMRAIGETPSETPYVKEKRLKKFLNATVGKYNPGQ